MTSDWSNNLHAFANKPLIGLTSKLVGKIMEIPRPEWLLLMLHWIATVSWPLISREVSGVSDKLPKGFISKLLCDSSWDSPGWWALPGVLYLWSHSDEPQCWITQAHSDYNISRERNVICPVCGKIVYFGMLNFILRPLTLLKSVQLRKLHSFYMALMLLIDEVTRYLIRAICITESNFDLLMILIYSALAKHDRNGLSDE